MEGPADRVAERPVDPELGHHGLDDALRVEHVERTIVARPARVGVPAQRERGLGPFLGPPVAQPEDLVDLEDRHRSDVAMRVVTDDLQQAGGQPRPEPPVVRLERVRDPDRVVVPHHPEVGLGDERDQPDLAQAGASQGVTDPGSEGVGRRQPARPRDRRERGADPLVPLDPHDLLDQVHLALEVDAVPGDLDADRLLVDGLGGDPEPLEHLHRIRGSTPGTRSAPRHASVRSSIRRRGGGPPTSIDAAEHAGAAPLRPSGGTPGRRRPARPRGRRRARTASTPRSTGRSAGACAGRPRVRTTPPRAARRSSARTPRRARRPSRRPRPPGRSASQISRSSSVNVRSTPSSVTSFSPARARRTTMPGPFRSARSNGCSGCPTSSIA